MEKKTMAEVTKIKDGYYKVEDAEGTPYILVTNEGTDTGWEAQIILESEFGYGETEEEAIEDVLSQWNGSEEE